MLQRRRKWDIIIFLHISPLSFEVFSPFVVFLHFLFLFLAFSDSIPVYLLPFSLHPLTMANLYCFPVPFFLLSLSLYSQFLFFFFCSVLHLFQSYTSRSPSVQRRTVIFLKGCRTRKVFCFTIDLSQTCWHFVL